MGLHGKGNSHSEIKFLVGVHPYVIVSLLSMEKLITQEVHQQSKAEKSAHFSLITILTLLGSKKVSYSYITSKQEKGSVKN